jgi:glycosyltransferase involved in cell wall biosynthesis
VKQGFIIPVYRHGKTACIVAQELSAAGLPVILVDDGNDAETGEILAQCAAGTAGVLLVRLDKNSGKGGAVIKGLEKARELGLTHALQVDADGQHDLGKVNFFLEQSAAHPDMVICGYPEFDETAPKGRVTGRKISNFWASVVTLSTDIRDILCGFRVYPVDAALRVTRSPLFDKRMGFDVEILVRLYWNKVYPVFYPVRVKYPAGGISNFRMVRDNIAISLVFCRLCTGMLLRLPLLIFRKIKRGKNR